ncbi:DUF4150 domain-containing protein [Alteromonadaceae bacterium BrNp21-10]|nr:DUF4150 domain-containing protein [Alteromonadaceae bacterium BrNp21-10]
MFGITTKMGGMSNAMPDVCLTPAPPAPPIPVPYPNIASFSMAIPTVMKTTIMNQPPITKDAQVPTTSGDEGGANMGTVSGMIKGPAKAKKFSMKVKIEGKNVVYQTCIIGHNGASPNSPAGIHGVPSQVKVTVTG